MKKRATQISIAGSFLSSFAILGATLLGFGGFSVNAFINYLIIDHISRLEIILLFIAGLGFILSALSYTIQPNISIKRPEFILLSSYLTVGIIFLILSIFGGTSQLISSNFWTNTNFKKIQDILFFNNLTLTSFLAIGTLQLILFFTFFNDKILKQHQLTNVAKLTTLISGILWILKFIIDIPLIKEAIFVISYQFNFPLLNNILSISAPIAYLSSQILFMIILFHTQNL